MEELKHLMLMWDSLHVGGCLLLLLAPYSISTLCILLGVLWKKEFSIARNVCVFMVWWYMVTIRFGTPMGIISTLFLFYISPRVFHEAISRLLPIHIIWVLNYIYPPPPVTNKKMEILNCVSNNNNEANNNNENNSLQPAVSIILCNMNESIETMRINIESIVRSKKFAEKALNIKHIRMVLSDGGSKNIDEIRKQFGEMFDLITIIPGGKLRGRHVATINEPSDIIVAYDSDRKYDIDNTYQHLKAFLQNRNENSEGNENEKHLSGVVGTSHYVNSDGTLPFNGGNSAYLKEVYMEHPFDTSIRDAKSIWKEEEIEWRNRLASCGKVMSVNANYSDIDPIPLMSCMKRVLNLKNSFGGGSDRSEMNETDVQVALKIATTLTITLFVSQFTDVISQL